MIGGNLETLDSLKQELTAQADAAIQLRDSIQRSVDNAVWMGANADRFRAAWDDFKTAFAKLQDELNQASTDVSKQRENLAMAMGES